MRTTVFLLVMVLMTPTIVHASPCHSFPWVMPAGAEVPESLTRGREAMEAGLAGEAVKAFRDFLVTSPGSPFTDGVQYAMAMLIAAERDPQKRFLETIGYLTSARQRYPDSSYAPWALCMIGDLYRQGGWYVESKGALEQFLTTYPDHPLTPGVLIGAGLNFLKAGQNLEGALVFRRVLDEPAWSAFHLEAALGLADGAAASKAWKQAEYWYQTVDLETPSLIRASPRSLYLRGLMEMARGRETAAHDQFLTAVNLHPKDDEAGPSYAKLGELLLNKGFIVPALWFGSEASRRFPGTESDFQGRAILLRWAVNDLREGHGESYGNDIRQRLAELGIAVPSSWETFREEAGRLVLAAGPALGFEAMLWMAQSYQAEDKTKEAMAAYFTVLSKAQGHEWSRRAGSALKTMVMEFYQQKQWGKLALFLNTYLDMIPLFGQDPEFRLVIADAYRDMELPVQALQWYDKTLAQNPPSELHERALAGRVLMAVKTDQSQLAQEAGLDYERTYPDGQWLYAIASQLGAQALAAKQYADALAQFAIADAHARTPVERLKAKRQTIWVQRQSGDNTGAITGLRQLIAVQMADDQDRLILADLLFDGKQYEEAVKAYEALRNQMSDKDLAVWASYRLALSYQRLGKQTEAAKLFAELNAQDVSGVGLGPAVIALASALSTNTMMTQAISEKTSAAAK